MAFVCVRDTSDSTMALVCVRRSTDLIHSDRFEREKVPRRVMVLPDKALTKIAAEAVGLPPEEAGGGQSASAQHDTVPFGFRLSAPSFAKLFCGLCGCGLWAERHRCSVTRLGSALRPARRLDAARRLDTARRLVVGGCSARQLRAATQLGGSARFPVSAARRLGGAAFAPSAPIAPPAPSALSAPSRPPRPPRPPRRLNCRPPSSARSGAPMPRGAAPAARARHRRRRPRGRRRRPVLCARGARPDADVAGDADLDGDGDDDEDDGDIATRER